MQARRNEKLARRNPHRIQKEIDDLKAITTNGGKLSRHEEQVLEGLEKDIKAVNKAREALGDAAPVFRAPREADHRGGVLGKRRRGGHESSSDEDVPDDVKNIPMPRDTPPPIPKDVMDKWWAKRRARRDAERAEAGGDDKSKEPAQKAAPPSEQQTVYESKPMVRDLRKEAVSAFVPTSVMMKMKKGKGQDGLMEPEEADRLEKEGYLKARGASETAQAGETSAAGPQKVTVEDVEDE